MPHYERQIIKKKVFESVLSCGVVCYVWMVVQLANIISHLINNRIKKVNIIFYWFPCEFYQCVWVVRDQEPQRI